MLIRWLKRFFEARLAARTRRELHELSDQRLRDLGLLRSQINELFR
jgi:uncharacterized protein YjiS (DUF1127 family)